MNFQHGTEIWENFWFRGAYPGAGGRGSHISDRKLKNHFGASDESKHMSALSFSKLQGNKKYCLLKEKSNRNGIVKK